VFQREKAKNMALRRLINSAAIRRLNIISVFHAIRENPLCSQSELSRITGLDKATTSAVVGQLLEEGLVERIEPPRQRRVGRPETALVIAPNAGQFVGARLEPGTIRIVTAKLDGSVLRHLIIEGSRDINEALERLHDGFVRVVAQDDAARPVRGIGVGLPGMMDRSGRLVLAPNLGWRDAPIKPLLEQALGAEVEVDNDCKAAALAERLFGVCRHIDDFFAIIGHSGIGGALFLGGRLYRGAGGFAGEFGHTTVVPGGRPCGCGKLGCLETYSSEAAILAIAAERGRTVPDMAALAAGAFGGDEVLRGLIEEVGAFLGMAIANVVNMTNPSAIVLGGYFAIVADLIVPAIRSALEANLMPPMRDGLEVLVSSFGLDAVPVGGVALAMEAFLSNRAQVIDMRPSRSSLGGARHAH
jgi:predicted NBD/HSP70 family sugar kinase